MKVYKHFKMSESFQKYLALANHPHHHYSSHSTLTFDVLLYMSKQPGTYYVYVSTYTTVVYWRIGSCNEI